MKHITTTGDSQFGLPIWVRYENKDVDDLSEVINGLNDRIAILEGRSKSSTIPPTVRFKKLRPDAVLPEYKSEGAAGMDLVACVNEAVTISPDAIVVIPTGLAIQLPTGYEAQVRPRSGLATKGIAIANAPGTVDWDFRGEICVIIRNNGNTFIVHNGDRIAQLVIARAVQAQIIEAEELDETVRGFGGFGSTGK